MKLFVRSNKINRDFSLFIEKFHNNSIRCQNSFGLSLNNNGFTFVCQNDVQQSNFEVFSKRLELRAYIFAFWRDL